MRIITALLLSSCCYGQMFPFPGPSNSGAGPASAPTISRSGAWNTGHNTFTGTNTWSHTFAGGTLGAVVVWVCEIVSGGSALGITNPMYNGVTMTLLATHAAVNGCFPPANELFYIAYNPPTGASTISLTSASQLFGSSQSYLGVAQSGQPDASSFGSTTCSAGAPNTCPATITNGTAGSWMLMIYGTASAINQTGGTVTGSFLGFDSGSGCCFYAWDSGASVATGSVTEIAGASGTPSYDVLSVTLKPH